MSESASMSFGIAGRYATALFELSKEASALDALAADAAALQDALAESADLRALIASPVYSREAQGKAMAAIAAKMGLGDTTARTLGLMAAKRRLFVLPQMVRRVAELIATERGEVTAEVRAAKPLSEAQSAALAAALKASVGKDVNINLVVDKSLIGGLIVKLGSRMVDTSIASKLRALQSSMKEVG